MLNRLTSFLKSLKSKKVQAIGQGETQLPLIQWLTVDNPRNPFGIAGCDCLEFVNSMRSVTKDEQVAEKFVMLRGDDGKRLIGALPHDPVEILCNLAYPYSGEVCDGMLFKASRMEEKWDIYLYQDRLYFCRSWTGDLVYVATFVADGKSIVVTSLYASRELAGDPDFLTQQIDYLHKSHLFAWVVPHPLPPEFPRDLAKIAFYSLHQYGQRCCFATYENTLTTRPARAPDA